MPHPPERLRVCFLVRALTTGGAERQLVDLARGLDKQTFDVTVLTFYPDTELSRELDACDGVRLIRLEKRGRWDVAGFLWRASREIRRLRPHIVHGLLAVANEAALLLGRRHRARVVWWLQAAYMDFSLYDRLIGATFTVGGWLSRFPDCVIFNSYAGREHHLAHGWSARRAVVVPSGFDTSRFRADRDAGRRIRRAWGLADAAPVVGLAARLDPIKDHRTLLDAAAIAVRERPDLRVVCVGEGPADYARALDARAHELGLGGRVVWAGRRDDMPAVYNAFDLACLCSLGEGMPNAIGEPMACEVPSVSTDAGDAARLIGDTGLVVPVRDSAALAAAWLRLLALPPGERRALGERARRRIEAEFSSTVFVQRTSDLFLSLARGGRAVSAADGGPAPWHG